MAGLDTALSGSYDSKSNWNISKYTRLWSSTNYFPRSLWSAVFTSDGAKAVINQEKTLDAFLGTFKYGRTGLNCFRTKEFEFTYKPGSDKKKDHAFNSEKKCKSTVLCNRAEGLDISLTASKDVVIIDRYKKGENKPSKLLEYAKELIHESGRTCKPGEDVGVNTGSTCKLKATQCTNSGDTRMLEKIIKAFAQISDEKGAYKLSSEKNTHCSGYGYCPSSMNVSMKRFLLLMLCLINHPFLPDSLYHVTKAVACSC